MSNSRPIPRIAANAEINVLRVRCAHRDSVTAQAVKCDVAVDALIPKLIPGSAEQGMIVKTSIGESIAQKVLKNCVATAYAQAPVL